MKHLSLLLTATALFLLPNIANAQIYTPSNRTPQADNSIGTVVNPTGANNFNIDGGLQRGQNLFHSFTEFSIPTGGSANFTNPAGNQSIITRVTGNSFSDINGTLNTNGANFLLINPKGVVFGTNARLDVGKAFVTSTASGVDFVDAQGRNYNFGVNRAGDAPLISIAPNVVFNPARLIMGETIPGSKGIENYGTLQTNNPGQYIGLIGGDVTFNGGQIDAPGGRVELGGLSAPGTVTLGVEGNDFRAQFPTDVARGDVSLTAGSKVNVAGAGGGDITVNARNVEISRQSSLNAGIASGSGTTATVAGDIQLNVTGNVVVTDRNSRIENRINQNSTGQGGNIIIGTGSFSLQNGAQIESSTFGQGTAGSVRLVAKDNVSITGEPTAILSTIDSGAVGKGGNIDISAGSFSLQNDAQLLTVTRGAFGNQSAGQGDAGNINVKVTGAANISGTNGVVSSTIASALETGTVGNAGNITIEAGSFSLQDGAGLTASNLGQGNAGIVKVKAEDAISIANARILSGVGTGTVGNGGDITLDAGSVSLLNGSSIVTPTFGQGNAGSVQLTAKNTVSIESATILSTIEAGAVGKGGNININAGSFSLKDAAQLLTVTKGASATQPAGRGDSGNVNVKVTGVVDFAGKKNGSVSAIFSSVGNGTVGNGGNITIDAGSVSFRDGAQLSATTFGQGNAGNVQVIAKDAISFQDGAAILSTIGAGGVGKGGNIDITAGSLSLRDGAQFGTFTRKANGNQPAGIGDAGNITVKVTGAIDMSGTLASTTDIFPSGIRSEVETGTSGNGGNITIDAGSFSLRDGALLTASTFGQGNAGTIKVNAIDFVNIADKNNNLTGLLVFSESPTGTAGDIILNSPKITVDGGGTIDSTSTSGKGGNISIKQSDLLLLRRGGNISTNAGGTAQSGGDGGNININSKLIVAILTENSDITANAVKGRGGNVNINAQGLFGIGFRPNLTDNSDITASSDFGQSGNVQINTPGIDPGKDTGELPAAPNDASNQISQTCGASQRNNKFYITGRGGLPPNASEPQESEALWQDARATKTKPATTANQAAQLAPPAIGWVFEKDGQVRLIAAQTAGGATETRVVCPSKK